MRCDECVGTDVDKTCDTSQAACHFDSVALTVWCQLLCQYCSCGKSGLRLWIKLAIYQQGSPVSPTFNLSLPQFFFFAGDFCLSFFFFF